jgi:hypothetical protein
MAAKTTLTATLPDGVIATRTTARTYTHVVCVQRQDSTWGAVQWAGRYDLAQTYASQYRGWIAQGVREWKAVSIVSVNGTQPQAAPSQPAETPSQAAPSQPAASRKPSRRQAAPSRLPRESRETRFITPAPFADLAIGARFVPAVFNPYLTWLNGPWVKVSDTEVVSDQGHTAEWDKEAMIKPLR